MKARAWLLVGAILALVSCGVKTGLERPAPMWGKARADYLVEQERLRTEEAARAANSVAPPVTPTPPPPSAPIRRTPISPMAPPLSIQPPG